MITPYPGRALCWMRARVRALLPVLDPEARTAAVDWLDDLVMVGVAVRALREGRPHVFAIGPPGSRRWWVVHPVITLPLIDHCGSDCRYADALPADSPSAAPPTVAV
jgi:hypothetical protein